MDLEGNRGRLVGRSGRLEPQLLQVRGSARPGQQQAVRSHLLQGGPGQPLATVRLQALEAGSQILRSHALQSPGHLQVAIHSLAPVREGLQALLERGRIPYLEPHVAIGADPSVLSHEGGLDIPLAIKELKALSLDGGEGRLDGELVQIAQALLVGQGDGAVVVAGTQRPQVVVRVGQGVVGTVRAELAALVVVKSNSLLCQRQQALVSRAGRGRHHLLEDGRLLQVLQAFQGERLQSARLDEKAGLALEQLLGGQVGGEAAIARPEVKKGPGRPHLGARLHHVANELLHLLAALRERSGGGHAWPYPHRLTA